MYMNRNEILQILKNGQPELQKFGVKSIALFGSFAVDAATEDSDIDLLVEFDRAIGLFEFVRLKTYLEQILKRSVDLTTPDALKSQLREQILKEAIYAS